MSLLETVALNPKKKHFKKIIEHVISYNDPSDIDSSVIDLINFIGIEQKYPILLGQTMKYLIQNGYKVEPSTFKQLVLFLERCKGFEEDAKRFIQLSNETDNIQANYELFRPLFLRAIKNKTAQDVLQLFE